MKVCGLTFCSECCVLGGSTYQRKHKLLLLLPLPASLRVWGLFRAHADRHGMNSCQWA